MTLFTRLATTLAIILSLLVFQPGLPQAYAQTTLAPRDLGFAFSADYGKYTLYSLNDVSSGAQTMYIRGFARSTTPGGRTFYPLATNAPITVDTGANAETVTPSAVTCTQNSLINTCTVTATFSNAHRALTQIRSGSGGVCEAKNDILNVASGGTVVIANGAPSVTLTSTLTVGVCGASTVNLLDTRAGVFQFYTYDGVSAYAASTSPLNSQAAANADVTTAAGAPFFYTVGSGATNSLVGLVGTGANTNAVKITAMKTRSTSASGDANTTIVTGDDLLSIRAAGADGTDYIQTAEILFDSTGTIAATRVPSVIKFYTGTDAAPTVKTLALTLGADQKATFAAGIIGTTAQFSSLTSGRVPIAGASGLLGDDSDLTFATDTLSATKLQSTLLNNTSADLALTTTTSGNITLTPATAATAAVKVIGARLNLAKGADVATGGASCVSGDCTLGGDGNFFVLTGTTTVDGFATAGWTAGSIIVVQTSGSVTFNNNGTVAGGFAAMKLVGGANVSMTADDNMILVYTGSFWDQISPTLVK